MKIKKRRRARGSIAARASKSEDVFANRTVGALIAAGERQFARAGLTFGHGTDNARDEAAALVFHALRLDYADAPAVYARKVGAGAVGKVRRLFRRRVSERIPAVYLTRRTWFAGLEMYVDRRVLIPRSPLAELIEQGFAPWISLPRAPRILDLGTGSGCIAIACAKAFPKARVDAVDISAAALAVAGRNVRQHRLVSRVRLLKSDFFVGVANRRYDVIISNPPYVGAREMRSLPMEYAHEPRRALAAGSSGLDAVDVILRQAARHLRPDGILVVEVGNTQRAVQRRYPALPFVWLQFQRGGGGVFLLRAHQLEAVRKNDDEDVRNSIPA